MKLFEVTLIQENLKYCNKRLIKEKIPQLKCVYFIFNEKKELIYIGKTNNLKRRITCHLSPRTNGSSSFIPKNEKIKYYSFIRSSNNKKLGLLEIVLTMILEPKYNYTGLASKSFSNTKY